MALALGAQPASPIPTPTRAAASCRKLWARPLKAVMADQMVTQTAMIISRLLRSASRAMGRPKVV